MVNLCYILRYNTLISKYQLVQVSNIVYHCFIFKLFCMVHIGTIGKFLGTLAFIVPQLFTRFLILRVPPSNYLQVGGCATKKRKNSP